MNTLSDTDEDRARPSVWPVYVAMVAITLACGVILPFMPIGGKYGWQEFPTLIVFGAASVLLGVVAIAGLATLRPWGWWCGAGWMSIFTGYVVGLVWVGLIVPTAFMSFAPFSLLWWPNKYCWVSIPFAPFEFPSWLLSWPGLLSTSMFAIVLLTWALVTRRRLFFPRA